MRTRDRPTARVANHSGKIADDENRLMSKVLKLSQFSQNNGVAKVNIRGGRIDSELYSQPPTQRKLVAQLTFTDDLRRALFHQGKGFVRLHDSRHRIARWPWPDERYLFLFNNSRTCSIVSGSFFLLSDF